MAKPVRGRRIDASASAGSNEPQALGEVLSKLFALRGYGRVRGDRQLQEMWQRVAGEDLAGQTRVLSLRSGVLKVGVNSSALLSQLVAFERLELLEKLQKEPGARGVRDLKFQLRSSR